MAAAAFALGLWRFSRPGPLHQSDSVSATVQLFFGNFPSPSVDCPDPAKVSTEIDARQDARPGLEPASSADRRYDNEERLTALELCKRDSHSTVFVLARLLAAVVALSASGSILVQLFGARINFRLATWQRRHVVVAGNRAEVMRLAQSFVAAGREGSGALARRWQRCTPVARGGVVAVVEAWDRSVEPPPGVRVVTLGAEDPESARISGRWWRRAESRFTKIVDRSNRVVIIDHGIGGIELLDAVLKARRPPRSLHVGLTSATLALPLQQARLLGPRRFDVFAASHRAISWTLREFSPDIAAVAEIDVVGRGDVADHLCDRLRLGWALGDPTETPAGRRFACDGVPPPGARRCLTFVVGSEVDPSSDAGLRGPEAVVADDEWVLATATRRQHEIDDLDDVNGLVVAVTTSRTQWTTDLHRDRRFSVFSVEDVMASSEAVTFGLGSQLQRFGTLRADPSDPARRTSADDLTIAEAAVAELFARWIEQRGLAESESDSWPAVAKDLGSVVQPGRWWDDTDPVAPSLPEQLARCGVGAGWRDSFVADASGAGATVRFVRRAIEEEVRRTVDPDFAFFGDEFEWLVRRLGGELRFVWTKAPDPVDPRHLRGLEGGRCVLRPSAIAEFAALLVRPGLDLERAMKIVWALPDAMWRCGAELTPEARGERALTASAPTELASLRHRRIVGRRRRNASSIEAIAFALHSDYEVFERRIRAGRAGSNPTHVPLLRWAIEMRVQQFVDRGRDPVDSRDQARRLMLVVALAGVPREPAERSGAWDVAVDRLQLYAGDDVTREALEVMCAREHDMWAAERQGQGWNVTHDGSAKARAVRLDPGMRPWVELSKDRTHPNVLRTTHTFEVLHRILARSGHRLSCVSSSTSDTDG